LAPMVLARRDRAWWLALVTTVWSVLGGIFGYVIGMFLFDLIAQPLIDLYDAADAFAAAQARFKTYGVWIVFVAGFTPIPYKIFTVTAGLTSMAFFSLRDSVVDWSRGSVFPRIGPYLLRG